MEILVGLLCLLCIALLILCINLSGRIRSVEMQQVQDAYISQEMYRRLDNRTRHLPDEPAKPIPFRPRPNVMTSYDNTRR